MRSIIVGLFLLLAALAAIGDRSVSRAEKQSEQQAKPELVMQTGHIRSVEAIVISPDNRWVATGSFDNTIKLWDIESGRELRSMAGHRGAVKTLASSPDGKLLASGGNDGAVRIWDVVTGSETGKLAVMEGTVEAVAFSPDGTRVASGGSGKTILVRDLATGMEVAKLSGHTASISAVAFSPDGLTLASGSADRTIKIWDIGKAKLNNTLIGHTDKIRVLRFNPTGQILASGGIDKDKTVRLWKTVDGKSLEVDTAHSSDIQALHFTTATKLMSGDSDRSRKVWDTGVKGPLVPAGTPVGDTENAAKSAAFSADGSLFATGEGSGRAQIYDAATGKPLASLENHPTGFYGVAFSSDRRWMAAASYDNSVKLWDLETGESLASKKSHTGRVNCVAFVPETPGRRIISGSLDGTVKIWDTFLVKPIDTLPGHGGSISTLAIGTKGKLLVTGSADRKIGLWNLDDPKAPPRFLTGHIGEVISVAISPDERFIASGSGDSTIKIWDVATEKLIHTIEPRSGAIHTVAFSPDGKLLAAGGIDRTIRVWDFASRQVLQTLSGHAGTINAISFNPAGTQIASSSFDKTSRIWDVVNGKEIRSLAGHSGSVMSSAFTSDGRWLASASEDGSIIAWTGDTGERVATLLSLKNGEDWLVAAPEGFFDGSPTSYDQLSWRFEKDTFNTKPVEVFFNEFYVPGLLADLFSSRKLPNSNISTKDRRQPEIILTRLESEPGASGREVTVRIDVARAPGGAKDLRLFRNGALVKVWRGDVLKGDRSKMFEATISIVAGPNRLTAYAFNADDVKSRDQSLMVTGPPALARMGASYILAIGVNEYTNPEFNLNVAVKDAETFADEIKGQQNKLGTSEHIETIILPNAKATKDNILKTLANLAAKIKPEDSLTIFYAGHGLADQNRFYLIPHDLGYKGSRATMDDEDIKKLLESGISDEEIGKAVEGIDAGQMLLVIDACNSGKALDIEEKRRGPMNSKGLAQLAYEKGMYILTAAQGYQDALEDVQLGHGYLTHALVVQGLKGRDADRNPKDGQILLREWLDYATERVPEIDRAERDSGRKAARGLLRPKSTAAEKSLALQRPRVFYRRESETRPIVVARY